MSGGHFSDVSFWTSIVQIFLVNVALSGDNAVVIAMAARRVPADYRNRAILWGGAVAILLRVLFTLTATYLLHVPGLMLVGGIVLYYVSCKLLREEESELELSPSAASRSVLTAVSMIFVADLTMSLDNVLAVAGASGGNTLQMMIGMFTSIAFIVACSRYIAALMNRFPWLVYVGAAILAFTAAQMVLHSEHAMAQFVNVHGLRFWVYAFAILACLASGPETLERCRELQAVCKALFARRGLVTADAGVVEGEAAMHDQRVYDTAAHRS